MTFIYDKKKNYLLNFLFIKESWKNIGFHEIYLAEQ